MTIIGSTIAHGATYTPSGGSNQTFTDTGEEIKGGIVLADFAETNFFARTKLYVTVRQPAAQSDGTYSKMKVSCRFVEPDTLTSGQVVYNIGRVELEIHPESGQSVAAAVRTKMISLLNNSAYTPVLELGALT